MGRREMCVCTCSRRSAIRRWAAFDSNWVSEKEVMPWMRVANSTDRTNGRSNPAWFLPTTLSIRNFDEYGSTNPASLLMTISTKPSPSKARRGRINFQTSGQTAFRRWIFGGFAASWTGALTLLFASFKLGSASLLLHCHTSPDEAQDRHPMIVGRSQNALSRL